MVPSVEDNNRLMRNNLWFNVKRHRVNSYVEISPDLLCLVTYNYTHIVFNCSDINKL